MLYILHCERIKKKKLSKSFIKYTFKMMPKIENIAECLTSYIMLLDTNKSLWSSSVLNSGRIECFMFMNVCDLTS